MNHNAATVLDMLEHQAQQRDDLELAWKSAVGAIHILFWEDEFSHAAAISERTVLDLGSHGTALNDQLLPFDLAITAAAAYAGETDRDRLLTMAAALPSTCELAQQCMHKEERSRTVPAIHALAAHRPWNRKARIPRGEDKAVLALERSQLDPMQHRAVWGAVERANDPALASELIAEIGYPHWWLSTLWLAQWLVHDGDIPRATEALRVGRSGYTPYAPWVLLPTSPPVNPDLRPALTHELRQEFLTSVTMPNLTNSPSERR